MTGGGMREYTEAARERYLRAAEKGKGRILDEFTSVIGCHRKAAIRLLRRANQPGAKRKCGRSRQYGATADWQEDQSGFIDVDLVSHCGESADGFYLTALSTVDVASCWSDCVGVWGKGQERVAAAIHRVRQRLPFPLLGLDSDNGGEFINQHLYNCCRREGIAFSSDATRSLEALFKEEFWASH